MGSQINKKPIFEVKMILSLYQTHLKSQLTSAQYLLLEILVRLLQSLHNVKIEILAEALPLPIQFESRRRKIQRWLSLPSITLETLWLPLVKLWIAQQYQEGDRLYLAIDRTRWRTNNLLFVSVIWQRRAIPIWFECLEKQGNSSYAIQTRVLGRVLSELSAYTLVVLGDREFCSVKLGRWLGTQKAYFCLRLKRNTEVEQSEDLCQQLQTLGLAPGQKLFLNEVQVTQTRGFGTFNVAAKWKKRYQGFAPDEAWFILTNFADLDTAISSYRKRFSIEEMFRDFKEGGYCLEDTYVTGDRLIAIVILIAIAYTSASLQGQSFKRQNLQRYIARPESITSAQKRHSAFRVGLSAYRWAALNDVVMMQLVTSLLKLSRNKLPEYQRGMRAMSLVLKGL